MSLPPYTPQTKRELLEVHACLFLGAPNNFYQVPNAVPGGETTLESTVAELHRGVDHVFRTRWYHMFQRQKRTATRTALHKIIDATYADFKAGRVHEGRMMCHQIEDLIDPPH